MKNTSLLYPLSKASIVALISLSLSGCIIHVKGNADGSEVSSVLGGIEVSNGKHVGNVSSVNGSIELEDDVWAKEVDTVNGSIEMGRNVRVESAQTVNGDIEAEQDFLSSGNVETVNGDIEIAKHSQVQGHIETVNGDIYLDTVVVDRDVSTVNGDMHLKSATHVKGNIVFHKRSKNTKRWLDKPVLTIENGVTLEGDIILLSPVELNIADATLLKKVQEKFDDR